MNVRVEEEKNTISERERETKIYSISSVRMAKLPRDLYVGPFLLSKLPPGYGFKEILLRNMARITRQCVTKKNVVYYKTRL